MLASSIQVCCVDEISLLALQQYMTDSDLWFQQSSWYLSCYHITERLPSVSFVDRKTDQSGMVLFLGPMLGGNEVRFEYRPLIPCLIF